MTYLAIIIAVTTVGAILFMAALADRPIRNEPTFAEGMEALGSVVDVARRMLR